MKFPKSGKDRQPRYPSQFFFLLTFREKEKSADATNLCVQSSPLFRTFVADSNEGSIVTVLFMVSSCTELNINDAAK